MRTHLGVEEDAKRLEGFSIELELPPQRLDAVEFLLIPAPAASQPPEEPPLPPRHVFDGGMRRILEVDDLILAHALLGQLERVRHRYTLPSFASLSQGCDYNGPLAVDS